MIRSSMAARVMAGASLLLIVLVAVEFHHLYFNRRNLPDLGPFTRFEFPTDSTRSS
jgi:hypothetical protein